MKKLLMLATVAFLIAGVSFGQDGGKGKKSSTHSGKTCSKPAKNKKG